MASYPTTYEELPVVAIDQESTFTYINDAFIKEYGWTKEDLLNKSVTKIMPGHMRDAHTVGFARYLATETSKLLCKPLPLSVMYKDGRVRESVHFIVGSKKEGIWHFAAIIDFPKKDD